ncbi:hypothetical protein [Bradyrhizobium vignae]|uniref:hypothetical protein n=1 Tax=Bradyrhizobium vignae TaxID=1549949 RepID=UPI0013E8D9BA|nr:hypothetical protein [Bradyrhizobium vignae]
MGAILEYLGFRPSEKPAEPAQNQHHDITDDQIKYAHELAEDRRRAWAAAARKS